MAFIDLLVPEVVKVPLNATDKPGILRELVQILKDAGQIDDFDTVLKVIQDREDKGSTGLEKGIAIPHGKTAAVPTLRCAIGIAPNGVDFDSLDGQPTKLFFLLVASPNKSGPHVEALAEVAKLARSPAFCAALAAAETPQQVVDLIKEE